MAEQITGTQHLGPKGTNVARSRSAKPTHYRSVRNDSFGIGVHPQFSVTVGQEFRDGDLPDDVLDALVESGTVVAVYEDD